MITKVARIYEKSGSNTEKGAMLNITLLCKIEVIQGEN